MLHPVRLIEIVVRVLNEVLNAISDKYFMLKLSLQVLALLMIILLEKVAPVPHFTDNFQRIFTIRRYHPRCETHMIL